MKIHNTLLIDINEGKPELYYLEPDSITEEEYVSLNSVNNDVIDAFDYNHPANIVLNKLEQMKLPLKKDKILSEIIVIYRQIRF